MGLDLALIEYLLSTTQTITKIYIADERIKLLALIYPVTYRDRQSIPL